MAKAKAPQKLENEAEYLQNLKAWADIKTELETVKTEEARLRVLLFNDGFKDVVNDLSAEGTFNLELPRGWLLKAVVKINSTIDEAALPAVKEQLSEMGVPVDSLFRYKPSLVSQEYKKLDKEQLSALSQCVSQSRGIPTLQLVPPKASKAESV